MNLRLARESDVPVLARLEQELFGVDAWSADAVSSELAGPGRVAVVADVGGALVGYAITMTAGDVVDLQRVAVRPEHRRQGLAHALLRDVAARATADVMLLEVSASNAGALAFYAAEGFEEIDRRRRYYRDGTDAVVMRLPLGAGVREETR